MAPGMWPNVNCSALYAFQLGRSDPGGWSGLCVAHVMRDASLLFGTGHSSTPAFTVYPEYTAWNAGTNPQRSNPYLREMIALSIRARINTAEWMPRPTSIYGRTEPCCRADLRWKTRRCFPRTPRHLGPASWTPSRTAVGHPPTIRSPPARPTLARSTAEESNSPADRCTYLAP
jgi:hypothetical protein